MGKVLLFLIGILSLIGFTTSLLGVNKLLLISFDGFRWDYIRKYKDVLPNFARFAEEGSSTTHVVNTFPTKTFPTHFTIVTGLYCENHGILGNAMYDPETKRSFSIKNSSTANDSFWWNGGIPIWITAQKNGIKSGTVFWPGSEATYDGTMQEKFLRYNQSLPFRARVDTVVDWMANGSIDFSTLYFHEPDATGHQFGPDSKEMSDTLYELDKVLGYIVDKLKSSGLYNRTNIIITADHGMTVANESKVIKLNASQFDIRNVDFVLPDNILVHVFTKPGFDKEVFDNLTTALDRYPNITVYQKSGIPERFHYRNNRRIGNVIILTDPGYTLTTNVTPSIGQHGYDNKDPDMWPVFMAQGPSFRKSTKIDPIQQVDIYPLLAHLLSIKPLPNNGSLDNTRQLLVPSSARPSTHQSYYILSVMTALIIIKLP